jgi:lytic murein transglycosylase
MAAWCASRRVVSRDADAGGRVMPLRVLVRCALIGAVCTPSFSPVVLAQGESLAPCVAQLAATRTGRRITPATWRALDGMTADSAVLAQSRAQPEFTLPIWDYLAVMADQERVDDGLRLLREHRATFTAVAARYTVDAETIAAVWGIESNFGRGSGRLNVLRSLATLTCMGTRRVAYFRGELFAALLIVQGGHVPAEQFLGSWAGAFGQTQFMPGIFWGRAVDFDGDGRRDLMHSVPDALASTANYLRLAGWRSGVPWGVEVRVPADVRVSARGWRAGRPLRAWIAAGVTRADGAVWSVDTLPASLELGLFVPVGRSGPAFLVTRNFEAIYRYNAAVSYALAIAHLSDRLRGGGPLATPWPTDDGGLSRAERRELHAMLLARGHALGPVDALLTPSVRAAVRAEQQAAGQIVTGRPGQLLLDGLRTLTRRSVP